MARLGKYISEEKDPENEKAVRAVEVCVPSALLASGMCLVDTPGLGSVFSGNTAATLELIPHIDAALVVLGADPPISGEELDLVADVAREVEHLVYVINKADRLAEADVAQARAFARGVLAKRLARDAPEILVVSAAERSSGRMSRDWSALDARLATLAHDVGADLVEGARRRGLARISSRLAHASGRTGLLRPLDESERRLATLTRAVDEAERALIQLESLFRVEEESLRRALEAQMAAFVAGPLRRSLSIVVLIIEDAEETRDVYSPFGSAASGYHLSGDVDPRDIRAISRLNPTACTLAVYASQPPLPASGRAVRPVEQELLPRDRGDLGSLGRRQTGRAA